MDMEITSKVKKVSKEKRSKQLGGPLDLSQKIKDHHSSLRFATKLSSNVKDFWRLHAKERSSEVQGSYSSWMRSLGEEYWDQSQRIDWIKTSVCQFYSSPQIFQSIISSLVKKFPAENSEFQTVSDFSHLFEERSLEVLDVGSCYNPFKNIEPNWNITAIDLKGSRENDVFECDFIQVPLDCIPLKNQDELELKALPINYYDVVIFCLLLEYLPDTSLRLEAVFKASEILKVGGLLVIVSPDSNHRGKNARLMKSWRAAIANFGLVRVDYDKLSHVHCMSFVKVPSSYSNHCQKLYAKLKNELSMSDTLIDDMMAIPQDKNIKEYIEEPPRIKNKEKPIIYSFEEFPDL